MEMIVITTKHEISMVNSMRNLLNMYLNVNTFYEESKNMY